MGEADRVHQFQRACSVKKDSANLQEPKSQALGATFCERERSAPVTHFWRAMEQSSALNVWADTAVTKAAIGLGQISMILIYENPNGWFP